MTGSSCVTISAVDDRGRCVPIAADEITVTVAGAGQLIALGNGDPTDVDSLQDNRHSLWHGKALAVIRSSGEPGPITCKVAAEGLKSAEVTLTGVGPRS
ncbi:MAG: hypothetical protein WAO20_11315 [Acidobacteriota bacterium]